MLSRTSSIFQCCYCGVVDAVINVRSNRLLELRFDSLFNISRYTFLDALFNLLSTISDARVMARAQCE
jgi:hypothetical protein